MTNEQFLKNLSTPQNKVDEVLDTDAYNEIDDQFAIAYLIKSSDKLNVKGITAAPFFNSHSNSPRDGMVKSYVEILNLLKLAEAQELSDKVYKGSEKYLDNETEPVESAAADFIANAANEYSPEKPLYIVAIGAITNVASAILKNPAVKENCVVVWLGGHGVHISNPVMEFNMRQDIAAARVVLSSGVPLIQLPCGGVVDHLSTSKYELEHWLKNKNPLANYLFENTVREAEELSPFKAWTRIIWDVSAIAWLLNDNKCSLLRARLMQAYLPEYDGNYTHNANPHSISYVEWVSRDAIFEDLFKKLNS